MRSRFLLSFDAPNVDLLTPQNPLKISVDSYRYQGGGVASFPVALGNTGHELLKFMWYKKWYKNPTETT